MVKLIKHVTIAMLLPFGSNHKFMLAKFERQTRINDKLKVDNFLAYQPWHTLPGNELDLY